MMFTVTIEKDVRHQSGRRFVVGWDVGWVGSAGVQRWPMSAV